MIVAPFKFNLAFPIFIRTLWPPRFVISIGQVYVFMGHNTARFFRTTNLYLPLEPYLKSNLKVNFDSIVPLSKASQELETESFAEVQFLIAVPSLANQIDWTILAMIVIGLF